MLKVAVIGLNHIGLLHCRVYTDHPDVELVAVCDLRAELARSAAVRFGARAYDNVLSMLAEEEIDIISVATGGLENGSHHMEPAMQAIEAGKSVLVEKPISNRLQEARMMVDAAAARGVRLASNLNHRFVPAAKRAKEWIQNGEIGHLLYINMKLTIGNPNESTPWIHLRALHPHSFDVLRYFGGDVARVQSFMTKAPGRTVWSTASINIEFASGAVGHLTGSYDMHGGHPIERCEAGGTGGKFVLDNVYESLTLYPSSSDEQRVVKNSIFASPSGFDSTFYNRIGAFIQEVKNNVPPNEISASGADALAVQRIIEAAILSQTENGAPVRISDIQDQ
ncbi:Gfo/Idh/MocA family oxidoreductase [Paenibacillus pasadenensis]|uniref:Gfo/Idh/MocA family protein n=1 Tax=Paenibacillus pasadenensis TaxID=217090 RepID=UPI00203C9E73|nr:Gfo/Idh/MocA family oxidoreductase [Paenibacillus pasadenensis]MCM3748792.1 Gfo/Idh/MocA family oxidoreductase [Paenibacillus pasadenensis]